MALAAATLVSFSPRFKASTASFNVEATTSWSVGRRGFASIVKTRSDWEKTGGRRS